MAKFKGRDLRIKVRTSTSPETFTVIGGARSFDYYKLKRTNPPR